MNNKECYIDTYACTHTRTRYVSFCFCKGEEMSMKNMFLSLLPYKWVVRHTLRRLTKDMVVYKQYPDSFTWGAFVNTDKWDVSVSKEHTHPIGSGKQWVYEVVLTLKQNKDISLTFTLDHCGWVRGCGSVKEDFVNGDGNIVNMCHFLTADNRVKLSPNILRHDVDEHVVACFWQQKVYNEIPRVLEALNEKEYKKQVRKQQTQNNAQVRKNITSILSSIE